MHPLIRAAKRKGRQVLEPEALEVLRDFGIAVPKHVVASSENEALEALRSLGGAVAMKVVSPSIVHKTEAGGVVLDVRDEREVSEAFARLISLGGAGNGTKRVLIYPFQPHDAEVFVGMVRDAQFGPVMTFGLGGIWVEVLGDVAYGIAPLSHQEAGEMLRSIRAHSLLSGARGRKAADRRALAELLVSLSRMALKETAIQEIDLNPVFPLERGYFVADARVII